MLFSFCKSCLVGSILWLGFLGRPAFAATGDWVGDNRVAARLITATTGAGIADTVEAGVEFRVAPGWHVYWRSPGDAGLPPAVDWTGSINLATATIAWPFPTRLIVDGLQNNIYPGAVVLPVTVGLSHATDAVQLQAHLAYAACGEVCVPYVADLTLYLPQGASLPAPEATKIAEARANVPGALSDLAISLDELSVHQGVGKPSLAITLRSDTEAFTAPDLFVESEDGGWSVPTAELWDHRHVAKFHVALPAGVTDAAGVCLTFVGNGHAASFRANAALKGQGSQRQSTC